jgi:hypothetical protein
MLRGMKGWNVAEELGLLETAMTTYSNSLSMWAIPLRLEFVSNP